jgi:hypothetical protein
MLHPHNKKSFGNWGAVDARTTVSIDADDLQAAAAQEAAPDILARVDILT